jgi:sodium pump decarboxylase gamma subunit
MVVKLLPDGIKLLMVGQIMVLSFIGCIILTIKTVAWFVKKFEKGDQPLQVPAGVPDAGDEDEEVAAAVAAAIHQKRNNPPA